MDPKKAIELPVIKSNFQSHSDRQKELAEKF
jgi:hypothetical protein